MITPLISPLAPSKTSPLVAPPPQWQQQRSMRRSVRLSNLIGSARHCGLGHSATQPLRLSSLAHSGALSSHWQPCQPQAAQTHNCRHRRRRRHFRRHHHSQLAAHNPRASAPVVEARPWCSKHAQCSQSSSRASKSWKMSTSHLGSLGTIVVYVCNARMNIITCQGNRAPGRAIRGQRRLCTLVRWSLLGTLQPGFVGVVNLHPRRRTWTAGTSPLCRRWKLRCALRGGFRDLAPA